MLYISALLAMIAVCVVVILCMDRFKKVRLTNCIFFFVTFFCYLALVLIVYSDVGAEDWNFRNTLPLANVSPFMFFSTLLYFVLPDRGKPYYLRLLSLLSVGMFLSPTLGCVHNAVIHYAFHPHFLLDYVAHFSLFLWGVYAVRSGQVTLGKKESLISGSFIVGVAVMMMILNVIFDAAFFGLSLNGKHNIYNQVLVANSYLSALIYFAGLVAVLFAGYFFSKLILRISGKGESA